MKYTVLHLYCVVMDFRRGIHIASEGPSHFQLKGCFFQLSKVIWYIQYRDLAKIYDTSNASA